MDPDKALDKLLHLCANWENMPPKEVEDTFVQEVAALDEWLSSGGRLPERWSKNRKN